MYDMNAPLNLIDVYDMNVPDAAYKICQDTWPTQPQRVKHVTFIDLVTFTQLDHAFHEIQGHHIHISFTYYQQITFK